MKKIAILLCTLMFVGGTVLADSPSIGNKNAKGPFGYNLYDDITRDSGKKQEAAKEEAKPVKASQQTVVEEVKFYGDETEAEWEMEKANFYPDANLQDAITKYQQGNYSGCLQEMISLTKIDPTNPVIYYYLGMAYTQVGNKDQAVKAYEYVMKLNSEKTLTQYATRGRDCLVGGPTCTTGETFSSSEGSEDASLDEFINAPYGNGFSDELNAEIRQKELDNIQETINNKKHLNEKEIERIQKFDQKGSVPEQNKVAEVTNEDVLAAIEILKKAGVTVSINPYQSVPINDEYSQLSMLLGGNNNNSSSSMMNMLPYLMGQNNGQKIDPQLIQSMMMNSMITDFTFTDNDKKH